MGDNNEQEDADLAAMNNEDDDNDDDNYFEVRYLGGRLDNDYNDENPRPLGLPDYIIPDAARIRLIIDASVTKIDVQACSDCTTLIEVVFHNKVIEIGRHAFAVCRNLRIVELPAGLLRVEDRAFYNCNSLRGEIVIPVSVQFIGPYAFSWCESLESVVFVPRTTNIELGNRMFARCYDLQLVTLPPNVRSIPLGFFSYCTSLTHLHIPENVRQIRWAAFQNCAFLERVTIHSTNLNLDTDIFANCPLLSVIMIAPRLWPALFASMHDHLDFIFTLFRQYHTQILDDGGGG